MASKQFSMDGSDWQHVLRAVIYNGLSSAIVAVPVVGVLSVGWAKATLLVVATAFINGCLVAAKKFMDDGNKM